MSINPGNTNRFDREHYARYVASLRSRGPLERFGADLLAVHGPVKPIVVAPPEPTIEVPPSVIIPAASSCADPQKVLSNWRGFDFISEYTAWADVIELPKEVHTAVAIQLVASVLNHNGVTIPHSDFVYPMDLWVLLITPSGSGRSAMLRGVKLLLKDAGLKHLLKSSDWASEPAMVQHFADNSHSLLFWSEFGEHLDFFNNQGGKRWFTDRYDDTEPPDDRTYRKTGKPDQDRPAIEFKHAPRINLLAASSDGWFFEDMTTQDSTGGFLPRWLIRRTGELKYIPTPIPLDQRKQKELLERLKAMATIKGKADLSEILPAYKEWYEPTAKRFEKASPNLGRIYFSRHRGIVFKLAVVYEVSCSGSLTVTHHSWKAAIETGKELEDNLFELLDTGMNQRGYELTEVGEFVRKHGPDGVSHWMVTRTFRGMDDLQKHVQILIADHTIRLEERQTSGRKAKVYVHQDYFNEAGS